MKYAPPGDRESIVTVQPRYDNFIGGKWIAPVEGRFRVNLSPATARPICEVADSTPQDIELALDAAHAAKDAWGEASPAHRARVLNAVADAIDAHAEMLAVTESWENGQLSALIGTAGGTPEALDVQADVSLGPTRRAGSG